MTKYTTSAKGRKFTGQWEANKLKSYQDQGGVWTIGRGHTTAAGGMAVGPNMTITAAQSDLLFAQDLAKAEMVVNAAVKTEINQDQFDVLVDLVHNIGGPHFLSSTVLRKVNAGLLDQVPAALMMWIKVNGVDNNGLKNRRKAECAVWKGTMQPKTKQKLVAGGAAAFASVGAVSQAIPVDPTNTDVLSSLQPILNSLSIFSMTGSTVMAGIGAAIVVGITGFAIYKMVQKG